MELEVKQWAIAIVKSPCEWEDIYSVGVVVGENGQYESMVGEIYG